ncbi:MAG: ABC transporter ATP-binding protein [Campylobacterales bacterium]|nr:ABC transporter ATP-binding protein [Campylobacterales bacterium]
MKNKITIQKPLVQIKNLNFSYNSSQTLQNINLTINSTDFLAIIGPNGGGKSTFFKLLLGLLKPQSGEILFFDKNLTFGYAPQNTNVNLHFPITVFDVVLTGIRKKSKFSLFFSEDEKNIALEALEKVGMSSFSSQKIGLLSGGQRQRVMIARALCSNPDILLLDEPTSHIDVEGQKQIYELLKELNKKLTIVLISHDISVTLDYADKVAYINKTLSYHDMSKLSTNSIKQKLQSHDGHICEVEILQLLAKGHNV